MTIFGVQRGLLTLLWSGILAWDFVHHGKLYKGGKFWKFAIFSLLIQYFKSRQSLQKEPRMGPLLGHDFCSNFEQLK